MKHNRQQDNESAVIKAIAIASNAPFKTAFMATLGVGLAQLTGLVIVLSTLGLLFLGGVFIYSLLT